MIRGKKVQGNIFNPSLPNGLLTVKTFILVGFERG